MRRFCRFSLGFYSTSENQVLIGLEGLLLAASRVDTAPPESFALKAKLRKSVVSLHHKSSVDLMLHLGPKTSTQASGWETLLPPMYNTCSIFSFWRLSRWWRTLQHHGEAEDGKGHDGQGDTKDQVIYVQTFCMPRENYVKEQEPEGVVLASKTNDKVERRQPQEQQPGAVCTPPATCSWRFRSKMQWDKSRKHQ